MVAGQRELRSTAKTDAIDRSDGWVGQVRELLEDRLAAASAFRGLLRPRACELLDVRARDEDVRLPAADEQ